MAAEGYLAAGGPGGVHLSLILCAGDGGWRSTAVGAHLVDIPAPVVVVGPPVPRGTHNGELLAVGRPIRLIHVPTEVTLFYYLRFRPAAVGVPHVDALRVW